MIAKRENMGFEIEKKFLLKNDEWRNLAPGLHYRQGYLNSAKGRTVRVRTIGDQAFLTIKGPNNQGVRLEFEYAIPYSDALIMLTQLCQTPIIEKIRHKIHYQGFIWEVDEFLGENTGLIFAEIELTAPDQIFSKPPWVGAEVTHDPRYYNANLVTHPFCSW